MKSRTTGRRCFICGETIQQNEKLFTDGKEWAHNHSPDKRWREVRNG